MKYFQILTALLLIPFWTSTSIAEQKTIDEPRFEEVPEACGYLSEEQALRMLRVEDVRPSAANEHLPTFSSNCEYSAKGVKGRKVGYTFKFMVYDMFDVETLEPMQIQFNASFAAGGMPRTDTLNDLGKRSFGFKQRDQTVLLVITGIQGPPDGANRPSEFIASYRLSDPDTAHGVRLEKLVEQARRHLDEWLARP